MSDICIVHDSYRCTIHALWCAECPPHCQWASFDGVEDDCRLEASDAT